MAELVGEIGYEATMRECEPWCNHGGEVREKGQEVLGLRYGQRDQIKHLQRNM